jgi:hypothetical protein
MCAQYIPGLIGPGDCKSVQPMPPGAAKPATISFIISSQQ